MIVPLPSGTGLSVATAPAEAKRPQLLLIVLLLKNDKYESTLNILLSARFPDICARGRRDTC